MNLDLDTNDKVVQVVLNKEIVTYVTAKGLVFVNGRNTQKDLKRKLPEKHRCLRVWPFGPKGSLVVELEHQENQKVTYRYIEASTKQLDFGKEVRFVSF